MYFVLVSHKPIYMYAVKTKQNQKDNCVCGFVNWHYYVHLYFYDLNKLFYKCFVSRIINWQSRFLWLNADQFNDTVLSITEEWIVNLFYNQICLFASKPLILYNFIIHCLWMHKRKKCCFSFVYWLLKFNLVS